MKRNWILVGLLVLLAAVPPFAAALNQPFYLDLRWARGTPELGRLLGMHIVFGRPEWNTRDDVPAEAIAAERQIFLNSDELQSKPEAAREKIVEGMLGKRFFAAAPGGVLSDQTWIHDASKTVGEALADAGATVTSFTLVTVAGA